MTAEQAVLLLIGGSLAWAVLGMFLFTGRSVNIPPSIPPIPPPVEPWTWKERP